MSPCLLDSDPPRHLCIFIFNPSLQIHDELLIEVDANEEALGRMRAIAMESCCLDCERKFRLKVPLLLKCSAGLSWGGMEEMK